MSDMVDRIKAGQWHTPVIPPGHLNRGAAAGNQNAVRGEPSFRDILSNQLIRFSRHAELRLEQRDIQLNPQRMSQLESAIAKAEAKGAKDALVVFRDVAMIVNIKNKTVVTAMDAAQMKDNVFTQIDSAVIIP